MQNVKAATRKARNVKAAAPVAETLLPAILPGAPVASALPVNAPATETAAPAEPAYKSGARDAATVTAGATNFSQYSDRDTAYLAFFGSVMRKQNDTATLAEIHRAGTPNPAKPHLRNNPFYTGSAKATDAGAINRLIKAGYISASESGSRLTATDAAKTQAAYNKH